MAAATFAVSPLGGRRLGAQRHDQAGNENHVTKISAPLVGDETCWTLVERKLLAPASTAAVDCLIRLLRADGERPHWRPGDMIELCAPGGSPARDEFSPTSILDKLPGPQHGAACLLPGGWPLQTDWVATARVNRRLPIASFAGSGTLDLLVSSGSFAKPILETGTCHRLLFETSVHLRIVSAPEHWVSNGPLLFIGDVASAALARAFLQEREHNEMLLLLEHENGEAPLDLAALFPRACLQDGTIRVMPRLFRSPILPQILQAQGRQIHSLLEGGAQVVVAGSDYFDAMVRETLHSFLGTEALANIDATGRFKTFDL